MKYKYNLSLRKGKKKGTYSIYKHDSAVLTGIENKSTAERMMANMLRMEKSLRE